MGIAFGSYSRDSERNGMGYVEVEVEVDKTQENFKRKMKEIKEFIENSEKIKENISLEYFYVTNDDDVAKKKLIKALNRIREILFQEIIFLKGKKQKNLLKIIDISIGSGSQITALKKEWQELRKKFNKLKTKNHFFLKQMKTK